MRKHSGDTPFKCPICSKVFHLSSELCQHKRVHTYCAKCHLTFESQSELDTHDWSTHSKEYWMQVKAEQKVRELYVCSNCGKSFAKKAYLNTGKRILMNKGLHATNVGRDFIGGAITSVTWESTAEKSPTCAQNAEKAIPSGRVCSSMLWCTLQKLDSNAMSVVNASRIILASKFTWTFIQESGHTCVMYVARDTFVKVLLRCTWEIIRA